MQMVTKLCLSRKCNKFFDTPFSVHLLLCLLCSAAFVFIMICDINQTRDVMQTETTYRQRIVKIFLVSSRGRQIRIYASKLYATMANSTWW